METLRDDVAKRSGDFNMKPSSVTKEKYRNDRFANMKTTKVNPTFYNLMEINIHAFSIYLFCLIIFMKRASKAQNKAQSMAHEAWSQVKA